VLAPAEREIVWDAATRQLRLPLPLGASAEQIRDLAQAWLQARAKEDFLPRCQRFAAALGVTMKTLRLSSAQTRWGSASADGSIRLNWRLIHFTPAIIDYVVAHELAHLREMNHSPAFWDTVRSVLPDFERSREALREESIVVQ
jgi:predicted metal-dependent hydrolase